jgi:hypothetical protein
VRGKEMSLLGLADMINETFRSKIDNKSLVRVNGKDIGLDERTGTLYLDLNDRLIIVHRNNLSKLNYYGGFEYIDKEHIINLGEYVMFSEENLRVRKSMEIYEAEMERKNNLEDVDRK